MQSETVGAIAKALSDAQAVMKPPKKGKTAKIPGKDGRQGYDYSYADLADVIECYREPLSKHGLALTQPLRLQDGHMVLETKLMHSSGEWISSEFPIPTYQRPQEQGSALTYARRYAVTALLGIAAEDDDDGARAQAAKVREDEAPPSGDAAAILDLAAELEQITGKSIPEIIKAASQFTGKDKQLKFFTDPRDETSQKWLKGTRDKLERELHSKGATAAAGSEAPPF